MASLGELVPLKILGQHQQGLTFLLDWAKVGQNGKVARFRSTLLYRQNFMRVTETLSTCPTAQHMLLHCYEKVARDHGILSRLNILHDLCKAAQTEGWRALLNIHESSWIFLTFIWHTKMFPKIHDKKLSAFSARKPVFKKAQPIIGAQPGRGWTKNHDQSWFAPLLFREVGSHFSARHRSKHKDLQIWWMAR